MNHAGSDHSPARGYGAAFVIIFVWLTYCLVCAFPIWRLEGDEISFSWGSLSHIEWNSDLRRAYRFNSSPGVYILLAPLWALFAIPPLTSFVLLCAAAGGLFCLNLARLMRRVCGVPPYISVIAFLSFQETFIAAAWANDMVLSCACISQAAVYSLSGSRFRFWSPALWCAAATTFRHDAILLIPWLAMLDPLFGHPEKSFLAFGRKTLVNGAVIFVVSELAYTLAGGEYSGLAREFARHQGYFAKTNGWADRGWEQTMAMSFPLGSLAAAAAGFVLAAAQGNRRIAAACAVAAGPALTAYFPLFTTPKYFLPSAFGIVPLCAYALHRFVASGGRVGLRVALLIAAFFLQGLPLTLSPGNPKKVYPHDGPRLQEAYLLTPVYLREARLRGLKPLLQLKSELEKPGSNPICPRPRNPKDRLPEVRYFLFLEGYKPGNSWWELEAEGKRSVFLAVEPGIPVPENCEDFTL